MNLKLHRAFVVLEIVFMHDGEHLLNTVIDNQHPLVIEDPSEHTHSAGLLALVSSPGTHKPPLSPHKSRRVTQNREPRNQIKTAACKPTRKKNAIHAP
jgi:hypothetical protein